MFVFTLVVVCLRLAGHLAAEEVGPTRSRTKGRAGLGPGFVFFMAANDEKCLRGACFSARWAG